jgi:ABC-type transport system involved in cytochrome c biogenesis permease subunit
MAILMLYLLHKISLISLIHDLIIELYPKKAYTAPMRKWLILFTLLSSLFLEGGEIPVMHEGRLKPLSVTQLPFTEDLHSVPAKRDKRWLPLSAVAKSPHKNLSLWPDSLYFEVAEQLKKGDLAEVERLLSDAAPFNAKFEAEKIYVALPLQKGAAALYIAALLAFIFSFSRTGALFYGLALATHTLILALRVIILERPPVSNMEETLIYVPWIASIFAAASARYIREKTPLIAGAALAAVLLLLPMNSALTPLQPVLNSRFWLMVHVLMIVASYGVLLFGGVAGHLYLLTGNEKAKKVLIPSLYVGVALLIPGTLLGGVWAAESWGRFWDWDPKEAWAFISAGVYLLFLHAWHYKWIGPFGLAIGSIMGLMAISFTWYGVNYILGTGLHSYGFGSGGQIYYWIFLASEAILVSSLLIVRRLQLNSSYDNK